MRPEFEQLSRDQRLSGGWRAIGSAWALVLVVVLLFAGFSLIAGRSHAQNGQTPTVSDVTIPRHDPACAMPAKCPQPAMPGGDW